MAMRRVEALKMMTRARGGKFWIERRFCTGTYVGKADDEAAARYSIVPYIISARAKYEFKQEFLLNVPLRKKYCREA